MKLLLPSLLGAAIVTAQNVLFHESLTGMEYTQSVDVLGYNATVVNDTQWRSMTTADFAAFDAIVLSDPRGTPSGGCGSEQLWAFLNDTKAEWSPAVQGNIVVIGGDPAGHTFYPGAVQIMINGVRFAAAGRSAGRGTGLYFVLSCFYSGVAPGTPVEYLDPFGNFTVEGAPGCFNDAHIVATADATANLTDTDLSNWGCSVHEVFDGYPTSGAAGFQALAIANNTVGPGAQTFADGSTGLPYIISRGATPAGCGDGVYQPAFGEECDLGPGNGLGCSTSCKCVYGVADAVTGTCLDPPAVSTSAAQSSTLSESATAVSSSSSAVSSSSSPVSSTADSSSAVSSSADSSSPVSSSTSAASFNLDATLVDLSTLSISSGTFSTASASPISSAISSSSTATTTSWSSATSPIPRDPTATGPLSSAAALPAVVDTPTSQPIIIGVEIIHITILAQDCTSTSQRPIYNTVCPGYPDYVGLMGLPAAGDFATVTLSSCAESPSAPMTLVVKTCHACAEETYTTSLPGWTPGTCHACLPYYTGDAHTHEHQAQPTGLSTPHPEPGNPAPAPASPVVMAGGGRIGAGGMIGGVLGVVAGLVVLV